MLARQAQALWAPSRATALARRTPRSVQGRMISMTAHTLVNPTPSSLTSHLASHPPSASAPLLYLLSSNIDPRELGGLIPTLQAIPNSIGTFSHPITTLSPSQSQPYKVRDGYGPSNGEINIAEPTLSLLTFEGARTFRTAVTGRPGAEVGRWQRPTLLPWDEDLKGSTEGDLATEKGWDEVWRAERGVERIPELEGYSE